MKAYMSKNADGTLVIALRAQTDDALGDSITVVRLGEKLGAATYEQLDALGVGPVDAENILALTGA